MLSFRVSFALLILLTFVVPFAGHAEGLSPNIMNPDAIIAGRDYEVVATQASARKPGKIEVVEAFSFACPHCNDFEPLLHAWSTQLPKEVVLKRLPVVFGREPWRLLAKAYYAGETLGLSEKLDPAIFKALHQEHRNLGTEDAIAEIFVAAGSKREQALEMLRSDQVAAQVKSAEEAVNSFKVTGVPTLIVAGKYLTSASMAGDYPRLLQVVDQLLEQERATPN